MRDLDGRASVSLGRWARACGVVDVGRGKRTGDEEEEHRAQGKDGLGEAGRDACHPMND